MYFLGQMLTHYKKRHLVVTMDQSALHRSQGIRNYIKAQERLRVLLNYANEKTHFTKDPVISQTVSSCKGRTHLFGAASRTIGDQ